MAKTLSAVEYQDTEHTQKKVWPSEHQTVILEGKSHLCKQHKKTSNKLVNKEFMFF